MAGQDNHSGHPDGLSRLNDVPEYIRKQLLTQVDMTNLANAFGYGWEFVAINMGLSQADVDRSKLNYPSNVAGAMFSCLNTWRGNVNNIATFENFIKIVDKSGASTVDWDVIMGLVKSYIYANVHTLSKSD